jgi:hypothetical protein
MILAAEKYLYFKIEIARQLLCAARRGEMESDRPVRRRMKHTNPTNTGEPLILKTGKQLFLRNRISNIG